MKKNIVNNIITIVFIISIIVFILCFSIALPIYFRPFYYLQINGLDMVENTGFTYNQIKEAYNEVLDFLVFNTPFGTGDLLYSSEGKAHFSDCKLLFNLNFWCLVGSFLVNLVIIILQKTKKISLKNYFKFPCYFYSGILAIIIPVVVGIFVCIDFTKAFEIFHKVLFPGKTNWEFDAETDQIIQVMPNEFFINCAILIGASLMIFSLSLFVVGIVKKVRSTKANLAD